VSASIPDIDLRDIGAFAPRSRRAPEPGPGRPKVRFSCGEERAADSTAPERPAFSAAAKIRTPPVVAETLREYGEAIREEIRRYLPEGAPKAHLYDLIGDYPARGGKMMRPTICIATARAFGASLDDAICSAAAIELMHNAILVHDDIQDGSTMRRGAPTLHELHGVPLAINAGDALFLLSLRPLFDNAGRLGSALCERVLRETERMAWESAEGQAMELGWRRDNCVELSESDYLRMALKKTAWLSVIYPARVGALIGTRGDCDLDGFNRFGFFLGVAFQIQDDLLNLCADRRYGKELDGDLFEGKRTLMLIHALKTARPSDRRRLKELLARGRAEREYKEVAWTSDLLHRCGSIDFARRFAHGLAGAALYECNCIFDALPDSRDKAFMQNLATWIFERV
jgi:geranylgeranyl diphosphate synthase, type II